MLTNDMRDRIKELAEAGKSNAEIAAEMNLPIRTVSAFFNGKNAWKKTRQETAVEKPAEKAADLIVPEASAENAAPAVGIQGEPPAAPSGRAPVTEQERIIALGVIREALETIKALYGLK